MIFTRYQHHIVRDLAWAISSPPLLIPEQQPCTWFNNEWYQEIYASSYDWLQVLDKSPEMLQKALDAQKDRRLGRYFETLWAFWLEQSPRYEIIEQNLPLRGENNTLGELDFLLLDKQSGKYLHWEVAVKFYLGIGDTRCQANWHGPGKKDRLDLKVEHMRNRQSVISHRPDGQALLQEMGYVVDACGIILKGRLFYPYAALDNMRMPAEANLHHLRSYWVTMTEFTSGHQFPSGKPCFSPLVGSGWMAKLALSSSKPVLSQEELVMAVKNGEYRLPLFIAYEPESDDTERFFIVPDDWKQGLSGVI